MQDHPLYERHGYNQWTIPIALHGHEVPIVGIGKGWSRVMTLFSWYSLLGQSSTSDLLIGCGECMTSCSLEAFMKSMAVCFNSSKFCIGASWHFGRESGPVSTMNGQEKPDWKTMYIFFFFSYVSWACAECTAVSPVNAIWLGSTGRVFRDFTLKANSLRIETIFKIN